MVDFFGTGGILAGLGNAGSAVSGIASLFGGGGLSERKQAALQYDYTMRYDREKWANIAAGAKEAGIHPLFAFGAPATSFQPHISGGGESAASRLSDAGQGLSRATGAIADANMRRKLFEQEVRMNDLKIADAEISVQKNASDFVTSRATGSPPPLNSVDMFPSRQETSHPGNRGIAAGVPPATKGFINADGSTIMLPSPEANESMEDNIIYQLEHFLRNRMIAPLLWGYKRGFPGVGPHWDKYRGRR